MLKQAAAACVSCQYTPSACPVTMIDSGLTRNMEIRSRDSATCSGCRPIAVHLVTDWS
jgi:hypothetical protein